MTGIHQWHLGLSMVVAALAVTASPNGAAPEGPIVLLHPERPTDGILIRAGTCSRNRYSIKIAFGGPRNSDKIGSITVNGVELAAAEKNRLHAALLPDTFVIDAYINECSRTPSPSAKLQLKVIHRPWRGNKEQLLDFWVGPDGRVTGVKLN